MANGKPHWSACHSSSGGWVGSGEHRAPGHGRTAAGTRGRRRAGAAAIYCASRRAPSHRGHDDGRARPGATARSRSAALVCRDEGRNVALVTLTQIWSRKSCRSQGRVGGLSCWSRLSETRAKCGRRCPAKK